MAIIRAYRSGCTLKEAARSVGRTQSTAQRALRRNGVEARVSADLQRTYALDESFFENIDSEAKAYWLGFITADGCIQSRQPQIDVNLARPDRGHVVKLAAALRSELPILDYSSSHDGRTQHVSRVTFHSRKLVADLLTLGVGPRKSFTSKPWSGPSELMRHYWRGVFDGDGALFKSQARSSYKDKFYLATKWHVEFAGSYDIVAGFSHFVGPVVGVVREPSPMASIFRARYGGVHLPQKIVALLYDGATIALDRKKLLADELMATIPNQQHFQHLTADELERLRTIHGSWLAAAGHLGTDRSVMTRNRKRLGIFRRGEP
jgi:hypothetical protein